MTSARKIMKRPRTGADIELNFGPARVTAVHGNGVSLEVFSHRGHETVERAAAGWWTVYPTSN